VFGSEWDVDPDWLERVNASLTPMIGVEHTVIVEQARVFVARGVRNQRLRKV